MMANAVIVRAYCRFHSTSNARNSVRAYAYCLSNGYVEPRLAAVYAVASPVVF